MRLIFSAAARADLLKFGSHLRRQADAATARDQLGRIRAAADRLIDFPNMGPPIDEGSARTLRIRGTPYSLVYVVRHDEIGILRIFHHAQDWRPPA